MLRSTLCTVAAIAGIYLYLLPTEYTPSESESFRALPDTDLAAVAEEHWSQGYRESAIAVLEYGQEQKPHGQAQANNYALQNQLLEEYTSTLKDEASIDGRLWKAGSGAVTGEFDSWEGMAGSTVADFFLVGDIRDVLVQSFIAEETDSLIVTLSAIGIATSVWPPADPAVSLLKTARKSKNISDPVVEQILKAGTAFKNAPNAKNQQAFIDTVEPIWEMSGKCTSWSQFTLMLKHSDSIDQIRSVNKLLDHGPKTAKQLNCAFAISSAGKGMKQLFTIINKGGQASCDAVYKVLRKGPAGISWLAKRPALVARFGKIGYKDSQFAFNEALKSYGKQAILARNLGMALCALIILACLPLPFMRFKRKQAQDETAKRRLLIPSLFIVTCLLVAVLSAVFHGPIMPQAIAEISDNPYQQARQHTRQIRCHLQEDDKLDPNDIFLQSIQVPIIQADNGKHYFICSKKDLGLLWPELVGGDVSVVNYTLSKRGLNPISSGTPKEMYMYGKYPLLCIIPCPKILSDKLSLTPMSIAELQEKPELFFVQALDQIKGIRITDYGVSKRNIAVDVGLASGLPQIGDFLVDANGRLAGVFTGGRSPLLIPSDFHKHLNKIIRCEKVPGQPNYQQFVDDVAASKIH